MGPGVSVGRFACAALFVASLVAACGGQSIAVGDDDGSAGEGDAGGTGGSGGSAQGGSDVGGSAPAGGTSDGGTIGVGGGVSTGGTTGGVAGSIPAGGVAGTVGVGGANPCPDCPAAAYGLVVHGDGPSYELAYNGYVYLEADAEQVLCPEQPVRGTIAGCGGGLYLTACEDPLSGPPCLSINGSTARYVDRRTGDLWAGSVTTILLSTPIPGVASGTLSLELLNAGGGMLRLTVEYTFCSTGVRTAIVCR